ncbi:interleukin-31 receptor subunit alpha [Fundulus diaphanus]
MSGTGGQNSDPKYRFPGGSLHILLLGSMLLLYLPNSSRVQVSAGKCNSKTIVNISAKYQHCGIHPDGVRNLDCFGKYGRISKCTWEPGKHGSGKTYTLIYRQPDKSYCYVCYNLTQLHKDIKIFTNFNLTVEVYEKTETANCTKAFFRGSPKSFARCDPPSKVLLHRPPGGLQVNVTWLPEDNKYISKFSMRYKALGSHSWNEVESQYPSAARLEKLNSSVVYVVQIRCVTSTECSQCLWSKNYIVPSELKTKPIVISAKYVEIAEKTGSRLISITWKFPVKDLHDGYRVTIRKESGEPPTENMTTSEPEIKLILSYSAYQLNISACNNASLSPAVNHIIPQHKDNNNSGDRRLNVTVHNSTAFTIYWRTDLITMYVCYSVEWMKKGHSAWYKPFFEDSNPNKTLSSLSEHLEPYKRYSVTLHMRPNKNTCNMKHINNSESTYGSTEFYYIEGSPVSSPTNISFHNVTVNSAVLQWSRIREEDLRGFLLGYVVYYRDTSTEHNITVDPDLTSFYMASLKSGTAYQVQISAFTSAGVGIRSAPSVFKTDNVNFSISGAITVIVFVASLLIFGSPVIKRTKAILWPSIPNPGHSNAVQKIENPGQLELLEALATLKVEEWDTKSLQILEREAPIPPHTLPSMLPLLRTCEDVGDSPEVLYPWSERDTDSGTEDSLRDDTADTLLDTQRTHLQSSPLTFSGGYTTMAMFQQLIPQGTAADTSDAPSPESPPEDLTALKLMRLDYVRQFSTSPPSDSEHMSTIL